MKMGLKTFEVGVIVSKKASKNFHTKICEFHKIVILRVETKNSTFQKRQKCMFFKVIFKKQKKRFYGFQTIRI